MRIERARVSRYIEDEAVERILLATDVAVIGRLQGSPASSCFSGEHQVTNFLIGFPRSALWIRQNRGRAFVADPSVATAYNRGQVFSRAPISPAGDVSDWFGVAEDIVREAVSPFDPRAAESAAPLAFASARASSEVYRRQRGIAMRAAGHTTMGTAQAGELEEAVVHLFGDVVAGAYANGDARSGQSRARIELVERARQVVAATYTENHGVREIAARCESSVFHLCRTFRALTGLTLFGYRRELRLRMSLESVVERKGDLSRVAVELGFFSHSHFTSAFRREFGMSPRAFTARATM
jgi:AraC family transcriptional regulator